jgi:anti-sigma B factor antagonist
MTTPPVEVVVESVDGSTVVQLLGEIDLATAPDARARIEETTDSAAHVVLDLGGLGYLDSAGLAMIDGLARRCREQGRSFGLVVPDESVVRTAFAVSGLDRVLRVHGSREDALADGPAARR